MATTTPNFGWPVPTSTDLVKDGATAIEALGDAIDTSLYKLEGGTTGQILAKATNADMDFAWITNDVGDITAVTAGTGITGGGTSGAVTVSFDQANFGGGQFAAGKNKIINGKFDIWQRGTSFNTTGLFFGPDRFKTFSYSGSSSTISQQAFTPGTAPVAGYETQFFCRISSTNTQNILLQNIEDVRTFANQTITVSFWAKSAGATTVNIGAEQNFGSGGSASVFPSLGNVSVTTSWARYSVTFLIPSIAGKTVGTSSYLQLNFTSTTLNNNLDFWGIQAEAGSVATPFQTAMGTIQGELAACQRYFNRFTSGPIGLSNYFTTTRVLTPVVLPVQMRIAPTGITSNSAAFTNYVAGSGRASSAVVFNTATSKVLELDITTAADTAGRVGSMTLDSGSFDVSAEL
jgi:hypothetical protein